jgi:hypothetical protein
VLCDKAPKHALSELRHEVSHQVTEVQNIQAKVGVVYKDSLKQIELTKNELRKLKE